MRKISLVLVLMLLAVVTSLADNNPDMNISGAGARAKGMGGAFIGIADDATAISWNPAGIAQLDRMEASLVGLFKMKNIKNTWEYTDGVDPSLNFNGEYEEDSKYIAPNFISFIVPLKVSEKNLVFGIAYQRMVDFGYGIEKDTTISGITRTQTIKQTGGIDAISPAVAIQIAPAFSIGAAANILVRGSKFKEDDDWSNGDYWRYEEQMNFSGLNFNGGILITPSKKFSIGTMLRLPFTMSRTGESTTEYKFGTVTGTSDTTYPDDQRQWTMPFMIGIGLAFRPTENMTLAFDYERRNYGSTEFTRKYLNTSGTVSEQTFEDIWMNCNQFRLGMEYLFVGPNAVFPLRLGFKTVPQVYPNMEWTEPATTVDSTSMSGIGFTGGFGMKMGRIWLDLAYEMIRTPTYRYTENYSDGSVYKEEDIELAHSILASVIFHF